MRTLTYQGITWHDDANPTEKELSKLREKYHFHELDIEDCLSEHERPKAEEYEDYLFLVFHIPYQNEKTKRVMKEEVNIFLGKDFIVTLHKGRMPLLGELWNSLKGSKSKCKEYFEHGTGFFLYELMNDLFAEGFPLVDSMIKELRRFEEELFAHEEGGDLLRGILTLKRNIITMRSILSPQRTLIAALEHKNETFIPEQLEIYFDDILDAIERQWALLDQAKEMSEALEDTHATWLSHKTNQIIRILTIFSVTMLPLTFITGFYGMNVALPIQQHPIAPYLLIGAMSAVLIIMLSYFWWKKWF